MKIAVRGGHCPKVPGARGILDELTEDRKVKDAVIKYLRKLGMDYKSLFQIGKDGLSDNLMDTLSDSLEAHELVKCNLLKTCPVDVREAAIECASATGSEVVHIVGHTFLLYRRSKENKLGLKK